MEITTTTKPNPITHWIRTHSPHGKLWNERSWEEKIALFNEKNPLKGRVHIPNHEELFTKQGEA